MAHTLPPRPAFLPDPPAPTISEALEADLQAAAGPSTQSIPTNCAICSSEPKYTCPGCTRRTCSLACSKAHKDQFRCTGQRDMTAFVPLKEVSEGVWADDYRWLEEGRRKIATWGESLPAQALAQVNQEKKAAKGLKRKRPMRNGPGGALGVLAKEMEHRGIYVEFMPEGMERRRKNQSSLNAQTQTLNLTLQFVLSDDVHTEESRTIHHRRIAIPLSSAKPASLGSLLPDTLDTSTLVLALPYHLPDSRDEGLPYTRGHRFFPPLDSEKSILEALRGTAFVEFPTIRVYQRTTWDEKVRRGEYIIMPPLGAPPIADSPYANRKRKAEEFGHTNAPMIQPRPTPHSMPALRSARPIIAPVLPHRPVAPAPPPSVPQSALLKPASSGLGLGTYDSDDSDDE